MHPLVVDQFPDFRREGTLFGVEAATQLQMLCKGLHMSSFQGAACVKLARSFNPRAAQVKLLMRQGAEDVEFSRFFIC